MDAEDVLVLRCPGGEAAAGLGNGAIERSRVDALG